jgi:hypothetical protein
MPGTAACGEYVTLGEFIRDGAHGSAGVAYLMNDWPFSCRWSLLKPALARVIFRITLITTPVCCLLGGQYGHHNHFDHHRHSVACRRRRLVRQGTLVLTGSDGTYSACQHCGKQTRIKELAGGSLNQADPIWK